MQIASWRAGAFGHEQSRPSASHLGERMQARGREGDSRPDTAPNALDCSTSRTPTYRLGWYRHRLGGGTSTGFWTGSGERSRFGAVAPTRGGDFRDTTSSQSPLDDWLSPL